VSSEQLSSEAWKMREIISLHIGTTGVKTGDLCWQLFNVEQGIDSTGNRDATKDEELYGNSSDKLRWKSFFRESEVTSTKYIPRSLFIDNETAVCDEIRNGTFRDFYDSNNIISSPSHLDAGSEVGSRSTYTKGYNNSFLLEEAMEKIRRMNEQSDNCQGYLIYHSMEGGLGSGFTSKLLERLSTEYSLKNQLKMTYSFFPSVNSSSIPAIELYNYLLSMHSLIEFADITSCYDNESLLNICKSRLRIDDNDNHVAMLNRNHVFAQTVTAMTTGLRNGNCSLNDSLSALSLNHIPYHRFHFLVNAFSPLYSAGITCQNWNCQEITEACFDHPTNPWFISYPSTDSSSYSYSSSFPRPSSLLMFQCRPCYHKYITLSLQYLGDIITKDVSTSIIKIKESKTIQFVDWVPTGFKCGISYSRIPYLSDTEIGRALRGVSMIVNTTAMKDTLSILNQQFDQSFQTKQFLHYYIENGIEEETFQQAKENIESLITDYQECENETVLEDDNEHEDNEVSNLTAGAGVN
jgi:tubulin alpha